MKDRKEVIKHSAAIQIENRITLLQRRTWNVLLANAYDGLLAEEKHKINVADLTETLGYESRNDKHLKESLKSLVGCDVEWNVLDKDGKWEWGVTTLLAEVKIRDGVCTYAYGPTLRERLYNPNMYARISLSLQNKFDSKHALALYELFVDYLHVDKNYGETPFIPIEDFKTLMGIPDDMHRQFKMLNRRVIKEPVEEINGKTDFKVKVEYRKEGRKVAAVKFRIRRLLPIPSKSTRMREQSADDPTPDIVTELARVGVSRNKAVENAHSIEFSGKLL